MGELSFAIGRPTQVKPKQVKGFKSPSVGSVPQWRILPEELCHGLAFWIDTLPGTSFFQKRTRLLQSLTAFGAPCPWMADADRYDTWKEEFDAKTRVVLGLLQRNQTIRWIFKRFFTKIRIRRFPILNDTDPITLEPVETPVIIHSFSQRKTYVFEAESFATLAHKKLLHHDGQIPFPQFPKNPLTNESFTLGQQMSLLQQCRAAGYSSWSVESYVSSRYSLDLFFLFFKTPLRLHAIRSTLAALTSWDAMDILEDFIESQHRVHDAIYSTSLYKWAISKAPESPRIQSWRRLCLIWYEKDIFLEDPEMKAREFELLQLKTLPLCRQPTDLQELRFKSRSTLDGSRGLSRVPGNR